MQDDLECETCGETFGTQKQLEEARTQAKTNQREERERG